MYSQHQQMKQQQEMQEYNAKVAEMQANRHRREKREQLRRQRKRKERALSQQRGAFAKAGLEMSGTPLDVMADTAATMELEALDTAYAKESQARQAEQRAGVNRMQASATKQARPLALGATAFQGVNQTARLKL